MSAPNQSGPDLGALPRVGVPERPWVLWAGIGGAVALGAIVFTTLLAGQNPKANTSGLTAPGLATPGGPNAAQSVSEPPPAPELFAPTPAPMPLPVAEIPPSPPPPPPAPMMQPPQPVLTYTPPIQQPPLPVAPSGPPTSDIAQRMKSPALIVDMTTPVQAPVTDGSTSPANTGDAFSARLTGGDNAPARATQITDKSTLIPQGVMIAAVLETAINSDLPGFVRAVVSRDVSGFDGRKVLIPRGSRLVGQYRSELALGQKRAFVVWSRLIRPDGVSIQLASPGTDPLGRAGLEGKVDNHWLERFGPGLLMTAINAALSSNNQPSTQLVIGSATQTATSAFGDSQSIKPTVLIRQGAAIQVFVARDLDFSGISAPRNPATPK